MKRAILRIAIGWVMAASTADAWAQNSLEQARILFDAGVQAYTAGRYAEAVESFQEAYTLSGKPQAVFSLAQAERRLFLVSQDAQHLKSSIQHFRKYLELVPEGGRRGDAAEALEQLELLAAKETKPATAAVNTPEAVTGKILISSATPGATISLNGATGAASPVLEVVKPGPHKVRVSAPGYITEEREITALEKTLVPVEIALREEPAYLKIVTRQEALISIDDRILGEAPLRKPIEVRSGTHTVTITLLGFQGRRESVEIKPGQTHTVQVPLVRTRQRILSYALFGAAGASLAGGIVYGALRFNAQATSESILAKTKTDNLEQSELDAYNSAIIAEPRYQTVELATGGIGLALLSAGAITYFFDSLQPKDETPTKNPAIGFSVQLGPSTTGLAMSGHF